jgi:hypothetical protein
MGELAAGRMTLDEFLRWDDRTETRYELVERPEPIARTAFMSRIWR